jgi:hypothetical protein
MINAAAAVYVALSADGTDTLLMTADHALRTVTSAHRHMTWVVPPAQLRDAVAAHVNLGARLVPSVPGAARRSLAAAVSESSLLAGRIEFLDLQTRKSAGQLRPGLLRRYETRR